MRETGEDSGSGPGTGARLPARGHSPGRGWWTPLSALVVLCAVACAPPGAVADGVSVVTRLEPSPPHVGSADLELRLVDADGSALTGAQVSIEANMNHAGMVPTFADLAEDATSAGVYRGELSFTMGGDWFLLVNASLADGRAISRVVDVPGVAPR